MASITTINASDLITNSRAVINTNFANLNNDKIETSYLDTDTTLAANSDIKIATQKAVKAYVDAGGNVNASTTNKGIVEEATAAEVLARTAAGGTGARLFINPSTIGSFLKFGGSGTDGALSISSGTTTIDLGGLSYVEKNYTSIVISGTGQLSFSNPHANGTIMVLKSQGNVTLTSSANPCIDARGMGSAAGAGRTDSVTTPSNGTAAITTNPFHSIPANSGATPGTKPTVFDPTAFLQDVILGPGAGGGGGGDYNGSSANGRGGPGGASLINDGGAPGSGSGNNGNGTSGAGGRGGGALYIECGGTYVNTSAIISTAGLAGTNSTVGDGAGGGGAAGTLAILYNALGSDTGTYTVTGGAKGTGANAAQDGGVGATSYSYVGLNKYFA